MELKLTSNAPVATRGRPLFRNPRYTFISSRNILPLSSPPRSTGMGSSERTLGYNIQTIESLTLPGMCAWLAP